MELKIAFTLLIIAVGLFIAAKMGLIKDNNIQLGANVVSIVGFLAGIIIFVFAAIKPSTPILLEGPPINYVPRFDDIPDDLYLSDDGTQTNEDVAAGESDPTEALKMLKLMEEWGRKESYFQVYSPRDECKSKSDLYKVRVFVVLFNTASGAEDSRVWRLANTRTTHQEAIKDFGESANLYGWSETSDCIPSQVIYESAVFRRYNVVVNVDVGSIENAANINDMQALATRLAELVDLTLIDAGK